MIKREIVLKLHDEHELKQIEIAKRLDITRGSVTQYVQGIRATNSDELRKIKNVDSSINNLARDIANGKVDVDGIPTRFCEICKVAQKEYIFKD